MSEFSDKLAKHVRSQLVDIMSRQSNMQLPLESHTKLRDSADDRMYIQLNNQLGVQMVQQLSRESYAYLDASTAKKISPLKSAKYDLDSFVDVKLDTQLIAEFSKAVSAQEFAILKDRLIERLWRTIFTQLDVQLEADLKLRIKKQKM